MRKVAFQAYERFQAMPGTGATTLPGRLETANLTEPVLVYQEIEYEGSDSKELVLSPVVWFPKAYDNPYARTGRGLMYGNLVYLIGNGEHSDLHIADTIQAKEQCVAITTDQLLVTGNILSGNVLLKSLLATVEISSLVARVSRAGNFADVLIRAKVSADKILQIIAKKNVVFKAAETNAN